MRRTAVLVFALATPLVLVTLRAGIEQPPVSSAGGTPDAAVVHADVVASGIPGAGAITQIGTFHQGGPFHDNLGLISHTTDSGGILDRTRIFVASTSNFGAPLAILGQPEGSILSIDVSGGPIVVPSDFASSGGQAGTFCHPTNPAVPNSPITCALMVYNAQNPAFLNSVNGNIGAVTAGMPAVSLPLGISLNSGFGRPWFANAPNGSMGDGTITVIDPNGAPLKGAPDLVAGGVF